MEFECGIWPATGTRPSLKATEGKLVTPLMKRTASGFGEAGMQLLARDWLARRRGSAGLIRCRVPEGGPVQARIKGDSGHSQNARFPHWQFRITYSL
jgi:hypothetical protein